MTVTKMYLIYAKSTGIVLGDGSQSKLLFTTRAAAIAYLTERYTPEGVSLWTVEKI